MAAKKSSKRERKLRKKGVIPSPIPGLTQRAYRVYQRMALFFGSSYFGFRASDFFRPSDLGFGATVHRHPNSMAVVRGAASLKNLRFETGRLPHGLRDTGQGS